MSNNLPLSYKEIQIREYKRAMESPVYFMKNYVKIKHPIKGMINFDLYPFQEETLQSFNEYKFNIILKSRQMGISTLVAAYSLWLMTFYKDKNILLISLKQEDAKDVVAKVRDAYNALPGWFKLQCIEDNRLSLKFNNGSQIKAASTTGKSGVGQALSLLIIDEAALIENADELWTSAQPTISTGGACIILSTPRGIGSWFYRMWKGAEESPNGGIGKNGFHPIKLPWDLHPDRTPEWRRIEGDKIGNLKKAAQEYDCDFLTAGENVFEMEVLQEYKKTHIIIPPKETRGVDRNLWIWEYPIANHSYIVSADSARGDGSDFSGCHVIDISTVTPTQVAEYKGSFGTTEYGNLLVVLATEYNESLLVVERENVGWATIQQILNHQYKNLFYSSSDLKYVDVHRQISNRINTDEKKLVPGFSTNIKTRPLIIENLERYIHEKALNIYSPRLLSEMETFIWKNGKQIAMEGYHDDLVMSLAIGLWVRDTAMRLRQEGIDLTKIALENINRNKVDSTPFYKTKKLQSGREYWNMPTSRNGLGNRTMEDLKWLIQ